MHNILAFLQTEMTFYQRKGRNKQKLREIRK